LPRCQMQLSNDISLILGEYFHSGLNDLLGLRGLIDSPMTELGKR
jgi:hypothetical protein